MENLWDKKLEVNMTHEIKVTLKETSEALSTWVSEEVNELVFISEVIGG
jgi:hypothetical protein